MQKRRSGILRYAGAGLLGGLMILLASCAAVQETPPAGQSVLPSKSVQEAPGLGRPAIPFKVVDLKGRAVGLDDFRGRNLVLVFYIGHT